MPTNRKRTREKIHRMWPTPRRPDPATLYRWLRGAVSDGLLRQESRGKHYPFRF